MKNKSIKMLKSTSEPDKEESLYIEDDDESIKKQQLDNSKNTFIVHTSRHEQDADRARKILD